MAKGNIRFERLPNFRQAGGLNLKAVGGERVKDGLLYRSANLHFITASDADTLENLGIRTILDLRSTGDYLKYSVKGNKIAAARFQVYTAQGGEVKPLKGAEVSPPGNSGTGGTSGIDAEGSGELRKRTAKEAESTYERRHYITNVWSTEQGIQYTFSRMNFCLKLACLFLKAVDLLCGSHLLTKFVSSTILNRLELWEHYKIIAEVSKKPIATSLRIIARRENLPLLVQCAAGKDRTGIIVALVLGCLAVSQQVIVEDYAESDVCVLGNSICCAICICYSSVKIV